MTPRRPCSIFEGGCSEAHGTTMPGKPASECCVASLGQEEEERREEGEEPKLLSIFPEKMMLHIIRRRPPVRPRPTRGKNYGRLRFLAIAARAFLIGVTEGMMGRKQTRNDVTATVC